MSVTLSPLALTTVDTATAYLQQARTTSTAVGSLFDPDKITRLVNAATAQIHNYLGTHQLIASPRVAFTADPTTNVFTTTTDHGLITGNLAGLYPPAGATLDGGLSATAAYWVTKLTSRTFVLSAVNLGEPLSAGAAVDVTGLVSVTGTVARLDALKLRSYALSAIMDYNGIALRLYADGLWPIVSCHGVQFRYGQVTVPYRNVPTQPGWISSLEDRLAGIIWLIGYALATPDPEGYLVVARCGYDATLAAQTGPEAWHHLAALEALEQACLMLVSLWWHGPDPVDEMVVGDTTMRFRNERFPAVVKGILDPYRAVRFGA